MRVIYSGRKPTLHNTLGKIVPGVNVVPDNSVVRELIAIGFFTKEPVVPITYVDEEEKALEDADNKMLTLDNAKTKSDTFANAKIAKKHKEK